MTNEQVREQLTDQIYNALKDIEHEEDVRLDNKAFITDHLAPKIQPLIDQARADDQELKEELAVCKRMIAKLTDQCRELELQVSQAKAEGKREVIEAITSHGYLVYDLEEAEDRGVSLGDMIIPNLTWQTLKG